MAIDSSSQFLQLGLLRGEEFSSLCNDNERSHSEIIISQIEKLFAKNNISYDDLTHIALISGPGSFTGLRAAISTAKAIGFAKNIPLLAIPTLLALSLEIKEKNDFYILLDAKREEYYCQKFSSPAKALSKETLIKKSEIPKGNNVFFPKKINIELLARFSKNLAPKDFPPKPNYVRKADAKKQVKNIIPLQNKKGQK